MAAIEFAMLGVPFFLLLFASLEISLVFLAEFTLDQAVDRVSRIVRTGEAQKAALSSGDFRKAICSQVSYLLQCDKLAIDLQVFENFSDLPPDSPIKNGDLDSSGFGYQLGNPQKVQTLRAYYKWPLVTDVMRMFLSDMADGSHLLSATAVFQTEPF